MHPLFPHLRNLCRLLESHDIPYFLAGGTMLGAVRDGEMISHDYDFDIDCLMDDLDRIQGLGDELAAIDLELKPRFHPAEKMVPVDDEVGPGEKRFLSSLKISEVSTGKVLGDIYIFTIFQDGIARRHDLKSRSYCNAKMSIPAWHYEGRVLLPIEGENFSAPRDSELLAEKIYGPDWKTPLKPGEFDKERTKTSGSVLDADRERLVLNALEKGWDSDYSDRKVWPPDEGFVINKQSVTWAKSHEPMFVPVLSKFFTNEIVAKVSTETSAFRVEQYLRYFVARTWYEHSLIVNTYQAKLATQKKAIDQLSADLTKAKKQVKARTAKLKKLEERGAESIPVSGDSLEAETCESVARPQGVKPDYSQNTDGARAVEPASLQQDALASAGAGAQRARPSLWKMLVGKLLRLEGSNRVERKDGDRLR